MIALPSPATVHAFWFGGSAASPEVLKTHAPLWFNGGDAFDRILTAQFQPLLETLSAGPMAHDWAARGPRQRLSAIIVLDQMSRNIFRKSPRAFAQDMLALHLCKEGLAAGEDRGLSEVERVFFYLPLEHSEAMADQERAVALFTALAAEARPEFRDFAANTKDYAEAHLKVIGDFGRFPHRNDVVGRESTPDEKEWLAEGGGF
ncbi:conserved hypothetical protein [Hyphomonas neptunium ATCC 15444]|uniref:Transmembrane protein n=2 Tax=Hyphomonas TaxID=85 RepID=Q0C4J8_HYPNA|nr:MULTISPECIES: DUF924 family protein [Hyphomonas]ABI77205.1 conserved hypothetical protein [Hyphomonas neptunium ATCC 15444]KCZ96443.1 hypothetical protein HHI_02150 [Hyphomonas hirschiana VP5]